MAEGADREVTGRRRALGRLRQTSDVPVLVLGGGVIGAGLFRELALHGIEALLVDRADVAGGASAGPSRMIHGGLRYLEYGDFDLVRESVTERNLLLRNAPHCVFPLPTTVPVPAWFAGLGHLAAKCVGLKVARPLRRGALPLALALALYDRFGRPTRATPTRRFASRSRALAFRPALTREIVCTATYYDAWISYPERLCLELLEDGEGLCPGAQALNYVAAAAAEGDTVVLRDELAGEAYRVRPRLVVNATGPWIDMTNRRLGLDTRFIGGTKGGHLILENPALAAALGNEMILYETPEGRVCIAFVWQGKPLIGSTDIRIDDPDAARCDAAEIDYMLKAIRVPFPGIDVNRQQILSVFTGVRPLARSDAAATGAATRSHRCEVTPPGAGVRFPVYSMIGGKWTPFRAFAEHVADRVLAELGRPRRGDTRGLAIGGGQGYPADAAARAAWRGRLAATSGLSDERLDCLLWRYGTRAERVAAFLAAAGDAPLEHHPGYSRREIEFLCREERVAHLDDLVLRRTSLALLGELTGALLDELATVAGPILGWSAAQAAADVGRTRDILRDRFAVDLAKAMEHEPTGPQHG